MNSSTSASLASLSSSSFNTGELDGYKFGTHQLETIHSPIISANDADLLKKCKETIKFPCGEKDEETALNNIGKPNAAKWLEALDNSIWHLIYQWDMNHISINASKCCALLIINKSTNSIQINRAEVIEGKEVWIIKSPGYESSSRTILPNGGTVVVFASAFTPSFYNSGNVTISLSTNIFDTVISSKKKNSKCEAKNSSISVAFLEKSDSKWWSKYVLVVS
jgi:hypothetical protein